MKGFNLASQWQARIVHLHTDSVCIYHWLTDALTGRARVRTKAASEMLVGRRLTIIQQLIREYSLQVDVTFVASEQNLVDGLTWVSKKWLEFIRHKSDSSPLMCTALSVQLTLEWIRTIHWQCGHPGIRRMTHFCHRICPSTTKAIVRSIIQTCEDCQSIDPAPTRWEKGRIEVGNNWYQLSMDITCYSGNGFLMLTDCGAIRFAVCHQLATVQEPKSVFFERSMPAEILTDNAPGFFNQIFLTLTDKWGTRMRYWSNYVPEGNGIMEQCHRTVKRIGVRSCCSIVEAMYWYSAIPEDNKTLSSMPTNGIYLYEQCMKGIEPKPSPPEVRSNAYKVGEPVWVKPPNCQYTTRFCKWQVDGMISPQTMLINGTPRHVKDLRRHNESAITEEDKITCRLVVRRGSWWLVNQKTNIHLHS